MQDYTHTGPADRNKPINVENLKGKMAIVTGGASFNGAFYSMKTAHPLIKRQAPTTLEKPEFAL
jgi:hypothetical protein